MDKETKDNALKVINDKGLTFRVRIVLKGDKYGRNDSVTHDKSDPLVLFYIDESNYLVSAYYLSTLIEGIDDGCGICLDGGQPELYITYKNKIDSAEFAKKMAYRDSGISDGRQLEEKFGKDYTRNYFTNASKVKLI